MNPQTELMLLDDYLHRLIKAMKKMGGADSRRAVRTWAHLEARIAEIETGKPAGFW